MPLKIYLDPAITSPREVGYVLCAIAANKNFDLVRVDSPENSDLKITAGPDGDFVISARFFELIRQGKYEHDAYFADKCLITGADGREDLISTIFYCINSLQEYNAKSNDELGRFEYHNSYQKKFGNVNENLVQNLIDRFCEHPKVRHHAGQQRKSKVFLTHDIDSIHGSWKEDGFFALKKLRPAKLFNLMLNEALGRPDWLNMDKIMKIEDEKGFRSTFYWLLYKDKRNSDYSFNSSAVQKHFRDISSKGWENGLHKSLRTSSFSEELSRLGSPVSGNRFHYLSFNLPQAYSTLEKSGLKLDTSLGFFEQSGFRNSYGLPFMPYNLSEQRVYKLVEVPMQVMDRTFFSARIPVQEIKKSLTDWFDQHRFNCVFTLNFHNNFFSELKYHGYIDLYKSLLVYFREAGFEPATQSELIQDFYRPEKFNFN